MSEIDKVIIIDDDEVSLHLICAVLKSMGFEYKAFSNSVKAWKHIQKVQYSLFIIDWNMPEMDGLTLTKNIRELYEDECLILMLTSYDEPEKIEEAVTEGVDDYQVKPITAKGLGVRLRIMRRKLRTLKESHQMAKELNQSQSHYKAIFDNSAVGVFILSVDGKVLEYNEQLNKIIGYIDITEIKEFVPDFIAPDQQEHFYEFFQHMLAQKKKHAKHMTTFISRSGLTVWVQLYITFVEDKKNIKDQFFIIITEDITKQRNTEEQLKFESLHDTLTGLPNRHLFLDRLESTRVRSLKRGKKQDVYFSLLILDVDRFNLINESLGHKIGDELIQKFGLYLQKLLHAEDTLARLTGDEFGIITENHKTVAEVSHFVKYLQESCTRPFIVEGIELNITFSIGVKCFTGDETTTVNFLRDADTALHRAKEMGANRYEFFIREMNIESREMLDLENELRKALQTKDLELYFQPQIDLNNERITGVEALLRWNHPNRGLLLPGKFIPLAERTGLIEEIGYWVLETAMEKMQSWSIKGYKSLIIAINFSAVQFRQIQLIDTIKDFKEKYKCKDNRLEIEITESILMSDPENIINKMDMLKSLGLLLSVDDFGTGYSSLTYLRTLPLDYIKIDGSFIQNIVTNEQDRSIVLAIIAMAHSLKKKAIAERVETAEQLHMLESMYCDIVQGYYTGKPMPEKELLEYFDKYLNKKLDMLG